VDGVAAQVNQMVKASRDQTNADVHPIVVQIVLPISETPKQQLEI